MSKYLLIDGNSILNRAFYGVPDLTNAQGLHTNAIYGFLNILFSMLETENPDCLAVAFDLKAPTFRHEMYAEYKGNRKPSAPEFVEQIPVMKDILKAMNVLIMEKPGLEADDILGTFAKSAQAAGHDVILVSGDKDLLQVSDEHILIRVPKTKGGKTEIEDYYPKDVMEKYGLTPTQFIELKALMGDSSDNYGGVTKVGEKTATNLLVEYGSLDGIYENIDSLKKGVVKDNLIAEKEQAYFCKTLATIKLDADIPFKLEEANIEDMFNDKAYELYVSLGLKKFLPKFDGTKGAGNKLEPVIANVTIHDLEELNEAITNSIRIGLSLEYKKCESKPMQLSLFDLVADNTEEVKADKFISKAAFSVDGKQYVFSTDSASEGEKISEYLSGLFGKISSPIISVYNAKDYYEIIKAQDKKNTSKELVMNFFDCKLASYVLDPTRSNMSLEDIALLYLESEVNLKDNEDALAFSALICEKSEEVLADKLNETNQYKVFTDIEMPLSYVLYEMESTGIQTDEDFLDSFAKDLSEKIDELEKAIYEQAGEEFNINSPKQLAEVLFEHMGLEGGKKTKTGYSTAADVLEKLAEDNKIVADILEYRGLAKLRSTYAVGLVECIKADGRIHTTFEQTVTATGRLSSTNPNLQNIPIRTELGRKIRKAFKPEKDSVFIDADYSQVELRILAHLAADPLLIEAFNSGSDVHAITASKVFNVPMEEVTPLLRRRAKAVNFGVVYGISSFGLSKDLELTRKEAEKYIKDYFTSYPGIEQYLDNSVEFAKENGYSVTMYNRRRPIPELKASQFMQREFGKRVAMNAPIQGTAADIMKIAMINVRDRLVKENLKARILIQVHDELLLEVPKEEEAKASNILKEEMENAASLNVRLEVDVHSGNDWYEAK